MNPESVNTSAEDCAQAQLEAYNARDIEAFAAVYSDDVQLCDLITGQTFCNGQAELKTRYSKLFTENPNLHCKLVSRICCGNVVIDEEHVTGIGDAGVVHAVATYLVDEGLITKAWFVREVL